MGGDLRRTSERPQDVGIGFHVLGQGGQRTGHRKLDPTRAGTFNLHEDKIVEIMFEHFEIDGYGVLELGITRKPNSKG